MHIEVKTRKRINSDLAKNIISKKSVIAIVTTGVISEPAKRLFDENRILWVEKLPEEKLTNENLENIL